jgi:23S rRNA (cytidine1920-2'-O)/16S rRNA (cytidine1409-2'-O)-methyltransferase
LVSLKKYRREYAKMLISYSCVTVNGEIINRPGAKFYENVCIVVNEPKRTFVSRGGYKLDYALQSFNINLSNKVCLDAGASTGGFTDCMLQHKASCVYAVDVTNQLDNRVLYNPKVISMAPFNIRYIKAGDLYRNIDFIACDLSFISLIKVLLNIKELMQGRKSEAICLIKPQFEVGKSYISKTGVVRDAGMHKKVIDNIISYAKSISLKVLGVCDSPINGKKGNEEFLIYLKEV